MKAKNSMLILLAMFMVLCVLPIAIFPGEICNIIVFTFSAALAVILLVTYED
jgi:hypothetical protein